MTLEALILSVNGSLAIGSFIGFVIGVTVARSKIGCLALLFVPVAMIVFIAWCQGLHPENVRSTSALDFIFGPLWPSLGAVGGYFVGKMMRLLVHR